MPARAVLFDLDGTLVDSLSGIAATVDAVLAPFGHSPCNRQRLRRLIGAPLETIFHTLLSASSAAPLSSGEVRVPADGPVHAARSAVVQECVRAYLTLYPSLGVPNTPAFPGIPQLLEACVAGGYHLALVTTKRTAIARAVLETIGVTDYFSVVIGADAVAQPKPHPASAFVALEHFGLAPAEAVVVGDTAFDIEMARTAGCRAIGVAWGYQDESTLLAVGAEHVAATPQDLGDLLLLGRRRLPHGSCSR